MIGSMTTFFIFILFLIILILILSPRRDGVRRDRTELMVERELTRVLTRRGYVVFGDLIIPSVSKRIKSTQIDHVIISMYGIFCIETKSHQGNIYGGFRRKYWTQYLGRSKYEVYNPIRQNNHHVASLEHILRSRLKAPIHSYLIFPYARSIKIDGQRKNFSVRHTIDRILRHERPVYTPEDVEAIAKGLALVSEHTDNFKGDHVDAVREYINYQNR